MSSKKGVGPHTWKRIKENGLVEREKLGKYEYLWLFAKTQDSKSR